MNAAALTAAVPVRRARTLLPVLVSVLSRPAPAIAARAVSRWSELAKTLPAPSISARAGILPQIEHLGEDAADAVDLGCRQREPSRAGDGRCRRHRTAANAAAVFNVSAAICPTPASVALAATFLPGTTALAVRLPVPPILALPCTTAVPVARTAPTPAIVAKTAGASVAVSRSPPTPFDPGGRLEQFDPGRTHAAHAREQRRAGALGQQVRADAAPAVDLCNSPLHS